MQSWQTDLTNLYLKLTFKTFFKYSSSIKFIRTICWGTDQITGRIIKPKRTQTTPANIPDMPCECLWVDTPQSQPERVILYLPGGAFILRFPHIHTAMISRLCSQANARALTCFYRLAPENPFPACLDDSLKAYKWLLEQGYDPSNIIIAGDSAGGGLTLSTLLALRDEKLPMPSCAVMMSPVLDMGDTAPSRLKNADSDAALPAANKRAINPRPLYIGDHDLKNPLLSPIYGDYHGLPPLNVLVSDSEMLLDDSLRLGRKCPQYGVDIKVEVWRKVPHVWQLFPHLPEATRSLKNIGEFICQYAGKQAVK